jgi:hypothetical protein
MAKSVRLFDRSAVRVFKASRTPEHPNCRTLLIAAPRRV